MASLIWTIVVVLFVLWLLGFALQFGGGLIHLLLVLAIIVSAVTAALFRSFRGWRRNPSSPTAQSRSVTPPVKCCGAAPTRSR